MFPKSPCAAINEEVVIVMQVVVAVVVVVHRLRGFRNPTADLWQLGEDVRPSQGYQAQKLSYCRWTHDSTALGRCIFLRRMRRMTYRAWLLRPFPSCENAAGKLNQKWDATAGTKFTKPGNGLIVKPCTTKADSSTDKLLECDCVKGEEGIR